MQLIERECKRLGLIPSLRQTSLEEFRKDPVRCIDLFVTKCAGRPCPIVRTSLEREVATAILRKVLRKT